MSPAARSRWRIAASRLFYFSPTVLAFVAIPWMIRYLGSARFGSWRTLLEWFGLISLLEIAVATAVFPSLKKNLDLNDRAAREALIAGIHSYARATFLAFGAAMGVLLFLPFPIPLQSEMSGDLSVAASILLASLTLLPFAPLRSLQDATERWLRVRRLAVLRSLIVWGLGLFLASQGLGVSGLAASALLGSLVFFLTLLRFAHHQFPGLLHQAWTRRPDKAAWKRLWKANRAKLAIRFSGILNYRSPILILSALIHPATVTPLYLTQRGFAMVAEPFQLSGADRWKALHELWDPKRPDAFRNRLLRLTRWTSFFFLSVLIPIGAFNERFVSLWVGSYYYGGDGATLLLAAMAWISGLISLWEWPLSASGRRSLHAVWAMITGIASVVFGILGAVRYGFLGALAGPALSLLTLGAVGYAVCLNRCFQVGIFPLLRAALWPVIVLALPGWGLSRFVSTAPFHRLPSEGWLGWGVWLALLLLSMAAFLGLGSLLTLDSKERKLWRARLGALYLRSAFAPISRSVTKSV